MNKVILRVDNDLCDLRAELEDALPGVPVVHMTMKSWGVREHRCWDFVWEQFRLALRSMGYKNVCAIVPEENTKLFKFSQQSGMKEYLRANNHILMVQEV